LPKDSHKNWAHVVDARNGPGIKNVLKQKPKEQRSETFGKIKRKHVYRKKGITKPSRISIVQKGKSSEIEDGLLVPDFIDLTYWTRKIICCGIIYVGQQGEAMVDQRYYKRCSPENHAWTQQIITVPTEDILGKKMETEVDETNVSRSDETEFSEFFSDSESLTSKEEFQDLNLDTDGDEGFCDKLNFRTSEETSIGFRSTF